ncbi:MAG: response regulator transcription factor [Pirellulales bacterium]
MTIRVVVADDHEVVRTGLASLLAGADIEIVAEAGGGNEAVQQVREHRPDVVLLDIRMADGDGLAALETIVEQSPHTKVVMLSTYDNPTYIARAVALGASDYVLKGSSREEIISTIQSVVGGQSPSGSGAWKKVSRTMSTKSPLVDGNPPLTKRETQVLRHVALGLSNKEIGQSLGISIETVKEHVQNILRKIAVSDRTQAAVWAVRQGIIE